MELMRSTEVMDCRMAPMSSSDPCMVFRSASRAVTHLYDLVLKPTGLRSTQFITLYAIAEHVEIAQWRMAGLYCISIETLSRRLSGLRKAGLVEMRIGANHGERLYRLTAQGREKVEMALPYWNRAQQRLFHLLQQQNWDLVLRAAEEVTTMAKEAEMARIPNTASVLQKVKATAA